MSEHPLIDPADPFKVVCPVCRGSGELREAVQAWDVPGAPVPKCPHCDGGVLDVGALLSRDTPQGGSAQAIGPGQEDVSERLDALEREVFPWRSCDHVWENIGVSPPANELGYANLVLTYVDVCRRCRIRKDDPRISPEQERSAPLSAPDVCGLEYETWRCEKPSEHGGWCGRVPLSAEKAAVEGTDGERIYPCDRCGVMRSKAEGGTVFAVCDKCWQTIFPPAPRVPLSEEQSEGWRAIEEERADPFRTLERLHGYASEFTTKANVQGHLDEWRDTIFAALAPSVERAPEQDASDADLMYQIARALKVCPITLLCAEHTDEQKERTPSGLQMTVDRGLLYRAAAALRGARAGTGEAPHWVFTPEQTKGIRKAAGFYSKAYKGEWPDALRRLSEVPRRLPRRRRPDRDPSACAARNQPGEATVSDERERLVDCGCVHGCAEEACASHPGVCRDEEMSLADAVDSVAADLDTDRMSVGASSFLRAAARLIRRLLIERAPVGAYGDPREAPAAEPENWLRKSLEESSQRVAALPQWKKDLAAAQHGERIVLDPLDGLDAVIEGEAVAFMEAWKAARFQHAGDFARQLAVRVVEVMREDTPTPAPTLADGETCDACGHVGRLHYRDPKRARTHGCMARVDSAYTVSNDRACGCHRRRVSEVQPTTSPEAEP